MDHRFFFYYYHFEGSRRWKLLPKEWTCRERTDNSYDIAAKAEQGGLQLVQGDKEQKRGWDAGPVGEGWVCSSLGHPAKPGDSREGLNLYRDQLGSMWNPSAKTEMLLFLPESHMVHIGVFHSLLRLAPVPKNS